VRPEPDLHEHGRFDDGPWDAALLQPLRGRALGRLQRVNAGRLRSNLLYTLRRLLPREKAEQTARGLAALIDGLWLRAALDGSLDGAGARAIAVAYFRGQLAGADER